MTTKKIFALAASAMAFIAISGAASAGTVSLKRHQEVKHRSCLCRSQQKLTVPSIRQPNLIPTATMAARSQTTDSSNLTAKIDRGLAQIRALSLHI